MFCYNCGKKLPDGAKFCKYCGKSQTDHQSLGMAPVGDGASKPAAAPHIVPVPHVEPIPPAKGPYIAEPIPPAVEPQVAAPIPGAEEPNSLPRTELLDDAQDKPFDLPVSDRLSEYEKTEIMLDDVPGGASAGPGPSFMNAGPAPMHGGPAPMHDGPAPRHGGPAPMHDGPAPRHGGPAPMQATPAPKKKKKKWPLVVLLLLVIFLSLGILGALFIFPDKVEEVVARVTGSGDIDMADKDKKAGDDADEEDEDGSEDSEDASGEDSEEEEKSKTPEWASAYIDAVGGIVERDWPDLAMVDMNGDEVPEIVAVKGDDSGLKKIVAVNDDGDTTSTLELGGSALVYSPSNGLILDSYVMNDVAFDVVYELTDGKFNKIFDGACRIDATNKFSSTDGNPNMVYTMDGATIDPMDYYTNLQNAIFSKGVVDGSELMAVPYDTMIEVLGQEDPKADFDSKATAIITSARTEIGYRDTAQFFVAPATGSYRFSLYGANGGGDGNNDYDAEAAVLIGVVDLTAGEKILVMTGGSGGMCKDYWDYKKNVGTEVPGGFNGGGSCYASGGGGGCTEIYYQGTRIAAAAGSGGGNYDERGFEGRVSTATGNTTTIKAGEGRGSVDGGGGGGGWYGGKQGKVDRAGYGGINGYLSSYFTLENEYAGQAFTMSGSRDGSALVEYLGK